MLLLTTIISCLLGNAQELQRLMSFDRQGRFYEWRPGWNRGPGFWGSPGDF